MPDAPVPPGAVTAAARALRKITLRVPCPEDAEIAVAVLEAAAPRIRAAERKRIAALLDAWACPCGEDNCSAYDTRDQIAALIGGPDAT